MSVLLDTDSNEGMTLRDQARRERGIVCVHTDTRNGQEFAMHHDTSVRYVPGWGWLEYDGKRWKRVDKEAMMQRAKRTARLMLRDAMHLADLTEKKLEIDWALKSEQVPGLTRMLEAASSEPRILARAENFDSDPFLLNCQNGILDLRTGELLDHGPDMLVTRIANATYRPGQHSSRWDGFLKTVLPPQGRCKPFIDYLQRWMGYCLTGKATEQAILFMHGDGQNGKSTLTTVIQRILGEYAKTIPATTIIRRPNEGIRNDLAALQGVRYVLISEFPENKPLDEAFVKSVTGGEQISARFLYKEWFAFQPEFKCVVTTNTKPVVIGGDFGIWRRIKLIPFNVRIKNPDSRFMDWLFDEDASGILNWALAGCLEWQKRCLSEPGEVTAAVLEYRSEMDIVGQFLRECTENTAGAETAFKGIYAAYSVWCQENGHKRRSSKSFAQELGKRYRAIYHRDGVFYGNITLRLETPAVVL